MVQTPSNPDIIVLGYITADVVTRVHTTLDTSRDAIPASIRIRPGGSGTNVAGWLSALGSSVEFHGLTGDDTMGCTVETSIREAGVVGPITRTGATPTITSLVTPDGARKLLVDSGGPFDRASFSLRDDYRGWLHVPAFLLYREDLRALTLSTLHHYWDRCRISIDLNSAAFLEDFGPARLMDLVAEIQPTVLAMNESEFNVFHRDLERLPSTIHHIVHRGANTSLLWERGKLIELEKGIDRGLDVVDTTGAGDALIAGFLAATHKGHTAAEALVIGHRVAQVAVTQLGGFPTLDIEQRTMIRNMVDH